MMTAALKQKIVEFHLLIETNPYIAQQKVYDFWNDVSDNPDLILQAESEERDALLTSLNRALMSDVIQPFMQSIGDQLHNDREKLRLFIGAMSVKPLQLHQADPLRVTPQEDWPKLAREVDELRLRYRNCDLNLRITGTTLPDILTQTLDCAICQTKGCESLIKEGLEKISALLNDLELDVNAPYEAGSPHLALSMMYGNLKGSDLKELVIPVMKKLILHPKFDKGTQLIDPSVDPMQLLKFMQIS